MSHSRQDRYLEPGGGTGLQLAPGEGWPGQSPPQGKVGFQELAGWQAMGSPKQVSHTLPSSVLRMPRAGMNKGRSRCALGYSPSGGTCEDCNAFAVTHV